MTRRVGGMRPSYAKRWRARCRAALRLRLLDLRQVGRRHDRGKRRLRRRLHLRRLNHRRSDLHGLGLDGLRGLRLDRLLLGRLDLVRLGRLDLGAASAGLTGLAALTLTGLGACGTTFFAATFCGLAARERLCFGFTLRCCSARRGCEPARGAGRGATGSLTAAPVAERGRARTGAGWARLVARCVTAAAAGVTTGGCGVETPMATAAAPATPALTPGETPPSQAKRRCGAAVANADQATVRRPR